MLRRCLLVCLLSSSAHLALGQDDERKACSAAEQSNYLSQLRQSLQANWEPPPRHESYSCTVTIAQNFRGEVLDVSVDSCTEDDLVIRKSVENAVYTASPLPLPENRTCLQRSVQVQLTHRRND